MRWIVVLVMAVMLRAYEYNQLLLQSQIEMYPKLITFDRKMDEVIRDGVVDFFVLFDRVDSFQASKVVRDLVQKHGQKLKGYRFVVHKLNIETFLADKSIVRSVDAIYLLKLEPKALKLVSKRLDGCHIYSFVYDKDDLEFGFLFAVDIQKNLVIYINKRVLQRGGFDFVEQLYSISRFIE